MENLTGMENERSYRKKRSEIWSSWILLCHIWGTFDLVSFNVILRSLSALSIFRNLGLMIRYTVGEIILSGCNR